MDTFQNLLLGFQVALSLQNITFCFIGVLIGTLLGVLPGIGPITGVAILIPITFGMNATTAIITMAGVYYGAMYGGSTASILINVPGESASVITTLDGYQMARKGRAGPALGMAALSSFIAGTFSVILLTFIAPPLVKFALAFGPPEYFALTFMGLTLVTSLSGDSMTKCLMSGVFGLLLACVGIDAVTGTARFAYGQIYLLDGFGFIGVAVGLFAVASEKFLELSRVALALRPTFSMIAGMEFLAASVPLGCAGSYSSAGAICPNLCTQLYDACVAGESALARQLQFKLARLWDLFRDQYPSSLKGGMVVMGRPVGPTRPPLPTATKERQAFIAKELAELGILETEPHGWQCFNTMRRFASGRLYPRIGAHAGDPLRSG